MEVTTRKSRNELSKRQESSLIGILATCSNTNNKTALVKFTSDLAKRDIDEDKKMQSELKADLTRIEQEANWLKAQEETQGDKEKMLRELRQQWAKKNELLKAIPEYNSINEMEKAEPERLVARVNFLVRDLVKFLNVTENLTPEQQKYTCIMVIEEAKGLTLEDIALMLHNAKKGMYGDIFNRLDGNMILKWLEQYKNERRERIMARNQNLGIANRSTKHRTSTHALGKPLEFKSLIDLQNLKGK